VPTVEGQISICAPAHRHPPPVPHVAELERRGLTICGDRHILPGQLVRPGRGLDPLHLPGTCQLKGLVIGTLPQRGTGSVLGYPPPKRCKTVVLPAVGSDRDGCVPVAVVHLHRHELPFRSSAAGPDERTDLTLTRPALHPIQRQLR
jgi:hypothetical protein